jgi:hypothetical protein
MFRLVKSLLKSTKTKPQGKQNRIRSGKQQKTKIQNQIQTTKTISKPGINPEAPKESGSGCKDTYSSCLKE